MTPVQAWLCLKTHIDPQILSSEAFRERVKSGLGREVRCYGYVFSLWLCMIMGGRGWLMLMGEVGRFGAVIELKRFWEVVDEVVGGGGGVAARG